MLNNNIAEMFLQSVYDTQFLTKDGVRMRVFFRVFRTEESEIPLDWKPNEYESREIDHAAPRFKNWVKRSFYMDKILHASPPEGMTPIKVNEAHKYEGFEWVDENKFVHEMYSCVDHVDDEELLLDDELL